MVNNCVPLMLTNQYGNKYPGIWGKIEDIYENNKQNSNPDYYVSFIEMFSEYHGNNTPQRIQNGKHKGLLVVPDELFNKPSMADALYKWRTHKQIYKFSKEFEELLYQQEDGLKTPVSILKNLPYDSIYIETNSLEENILGFFFYRDYNAYSYVIVYDDLTHGNAGINYDERTQESTTLKDAILQMSERNNLEYLAELIFQDDKYISLIAKMLQLVLYICAENKEVEENPEQKKITRKPKDKKFIKDKYREIQIWDCGNKITEKIRTFLVSDKHSSNIVVQRNSSGIGKFKTPHSRKGHWHHFWVGKIGTEERKLILRWVAPTFVNGTPNTVNINMVETEQ